MAKITKPVKIKLSSAWGKIQRKRIVGMATNITYGNYRDGDVFQVDESDQKHEPTRFVLVVAPKKAKTPRKRKVTKVAK